MPHSDPSDSQPDTSSAGVRTPPPWLPPAPPGLGGEGEEAWRKREPRRQPLEDVHIDDLLRLVVEGQGSHLHLNVGVPPIIRADGHLRPTPYERVTAKDAERLIFDIMTDRQAEFLREHLRHEFSYQLPRTARFGISIYKHLDYWGAVFTRIPQVVPTLDELQMPAVLREVAVHGCRRGGLMLVGGAKGSGKSTTLAAMVNEINTTYSESILILEAWVMFVHQHKYSIITQRELGLNFKDFPEAIRGAQLMDANVLQISPGRLTPEILEAALDAVASGMRVLLEVPGEWASIPDSLRALVEQFPPHRQPAIRQSLATAPVSAVFQRLLRRANQPGRVAVLEIMLPSPSILVWIREGRWDYILRVMASGLGGMVTLSQSLRKLQEQGILTEEQVRQYSPEGEGAGAEE